MSKKGVHQKGYRHDEHSRFRPSMFDYIKLEQYVAADHPMRKSETFTTSLVNGINTRGSSSRIAGGSVISGEGS